MHEFIDGILLLMKQSISTNNINLINEVELVTLSIDQPLISQVVINLVKNGIEAMSDSDKQEKSLSIKGFMKNDQYVLEISDSANGIPESKVDQIFIPFFTTKKEGSGIGLSLSRQIMSAHKGSLELKSTSEEGTVFELRFCVK